MGVKLPIIGSHGENVKSRSISQQNILLVYILFEHGLVEILVLHLFFISTTVRNRLKVTENN